MAAAIKEEIGVDAELIRGGGGIFLVIAEGVTLFSKKEVGRFPENEEIMTKLRNR